MMIHISFNILNGRQEEDGKETLIGAIKDETIKVYVKDKMSLAKKNLSIVWMRKKEHIRLRIK
jgi:hypothetical protein